MITDATLHTPEPWEISPDGRSIVGSPRPGHRDRCGVPVVPLIATLANRGAEETAANGNLTIAAPALLGQLVKLEQIITQAAEDGELWKNEFVRPGAGRTAGDAHRDSVEARAHNRAVLEARDIAREVIAKATGAEE